MKDPAPPRKSKAVQIDMPSPWQKYANVILIPIIIGLTVFLLIRFRMNSAEQARFEARDKLTAVRSRLTDLGLYEFGRFPQEEVDRYRDQRYAETDRFITELLGTAKDPFIRAEAMVARGDLNWLIGNFPALPGATTRPSLKGPKTSDEHLAEAEKAYDEVLQEPLVKEHFSAVSARMGLAAIAENRRNWDEANKQYDMVVQDDQAPQAFKTQAMERIEQIKTIRKPIYIGRVTPPSTQPATLPGTTSSTTQTTK